MYIKQKCDKKLYTFYQRNRANINKEESFYKRDHLIYRSEDESEQYSPARTVHRRESLIFDFELTGHHHET